MDQIKLITLIESVRCRTQMYIGIPDAQGLHLLLCELLDNAIDACLIGTGKTITLDLRPDGGIRIHYTSLIYPFSPTDDIPQILQDACLEGHGPRPDHSASFINTFKHNYWEWHLCITNALSRSLSIEIHHNGQRWHLSFQDQQLVTCTNTSIATTDTTTTLTFYPDQAIFNDAHPQPERIAQYLRQSSYLIPGLAFTLNDYQSTPPHTSHFPQTTGLAQYLHDLTRAYYPLSPPILISDESEQITIHIAFQYSTGPTQILSFLNNRPTPGHGSHVTAFLDALQRTLRALSLQANPSSNPSFPLYRIIPHLTAIISIWTIRPAFIDNTGKLRHSKIRHVVYTATKKILQSHLNDLQPLLTHPPNP